MATTVWVDGVVTDAATARVPALDHGITVGDGVFETCTVVGGVPFALTRPLARLLRSAVALALPVPSNDELRGAVAETLAADADARGPLAFGRLRITLTGGVGPLGPARGGRRAPRLRPGGGCEDADRRGVAVGAMAGAGRRRDGRVDA